MDTLGLERVEPEPIGRIEVQAGPVHPVKTAAVALLGWWKAVTLDALIVGVLWLVGLELLHVPFAPVWALVGAMCQFVPGVGGMLALAGPVLAVALSGHDEERLWFVLGLYGVIVILEGLVIGPLILRRTTMVPWWASLLGPIVLGILIPFWGVLLAPPLLAIVFAFRRRRRTESQPSSLNRVSPRR